jgi:glutathione S-transferase
MPFDDYLDACTVNCRKVLAGLDLIPTKYNLYHVDYLKGEQMTPEYLKINPHATVPSSVDRNHTITESNAILRYAADREGGHLAYAKDLLLRSKVNARPLWEA